MYNYLPLKTKNYGSLCYNASYLEAYKETLASYIEEEKEINTLKFAKKMLKNQEIKTNNLIEGITDDLSIIEEAIKHQRRKETLEEEKRILNLYRGYRYILKEKEINKETLKELYALLSKDLLSSYDITHMGPYYRAEDVYIFSKARLDKDPYMGISPNEVEIYMDMLLSYINENNNDNKIDTFIKAQIIHYFFVYIHPYFDVNGRTSRTTAIWYLIKNKSYPFVIMNRAISFKRREYIDNIIKTRESGNITLFLKFMLTNVLYSLEEENFLLTISKFINSELSLEERQMLEYLLHSKGSELTVKDLAFIYNVYNKRKRPYNIYEEQIIPLINKNILIPKGTTNSLLKKGKPNIRLVLNQEILRSINYDSVKDLKLERFLIKK